MQYDENAEKYGYEGEMTPLKCDELKDYVAGLNGILHENKCHGEVYLKKDVDAAIAELKDVIHELQVDLEGAKATAYAESVDAGMENRRLKRALWIARAERAKTEHLSKIMYSTLYRDFIAKWVNVERKCRAKAEEYK